MEKHMFCRQCEEAAGGKGCSVAGVCGKDSDTAILQDLLVHALKSISIYSNMARELGIKNTELDCFIIDALFVTVTNVNFDTKKIGKIVVEASMLKKRIKENFEHVYKERYGRDFQGNLPDVAGWEAADSFEKLLEQAKHVGVLSDSKLNEDIRSLREILLYGLKGMAAYASHAAILGKEDEKVSSFFHKGLKALTDDSLSGDALVGLIMEFGGVNLKCMELLDSAHTEAFGHPVPNEASLSLKKGPAIVISGHDLLDLKQLLEQTEGKGINIYTHGEMLPAHGYPELNKYAHLAGHYGGAWQNQRKEFDEFPGAILMTTNCIQRPKDSYKDRIFTTGVVAWPGVEHITASNNKKDFSKVIGKALALKGFSEDKINKSIIVGFGHNAVLGVADKIIGLVKSGKIKHFFLVGGCDGARPGRNYYTEFAEKVPKDCVILTLACGKFRFNMQDFGYIDDIPRLVDCGQCNDAYSAIKIASALADAFGCGVNDLPLSLVLSWYEQKAVCILLTLLSLGIKNIKLGPSLPAFISPNIFKFLIEKFNIQPVTTPENDLKQILGVEAVRQSTV